MGLLPSLLIKALTSTGLFSMPLTLIPMAGGDVNQSYKLICGESQYFLKIFAQCHLIPHDRHTIYSLQTQLALLGIAPQPIYLSDKQEFQVEQWVDRPCLATVDLPRSKKIKELAAALWQIHSLRVPAQKLDLPGIWQGYRDRAALCDDAELAEEVERCQQLWLSSCQQDQVLCHNDLAMGHVMLGQPSLVLDWEYAATGNRFFDLASCAIINGLDPEEINLLQQSYSEYASLPLQQVRQQMNIQRQLVELSNRLWYLAAAMVKP